MKRREFIELSGLALGASVVPDEVHGAPSPGRSQPPRRQLGDVVVVGAGAFGSWTAFYLRERGHGCTLVDAYGPGNPRSTSGGDTRQIRAGYGDQEVYTRWAVEALERWTHWSAEWGEELLVPTGRLSFAPEMTPSLRDTARTLTRVGVEHAVLDRDELAYAAAIRAALACRVVAEQFERRGGELRIARVEPGRSAGGRLVSVTTAEGEEIEAGTFVFACGPWLPRMFPQLLGGKISTPRRDVFYFGTPAGDDRFSHPILPNFSESDHPYYGFPSVDHRGVKICPVGGNVAFDPDTDERLVTSYHLKRAREYVAMRFPELAHEPVIESRVCQLEDTADADFIIDRHPEWENVWLAGGGSGHAFKHGPVLGDYVAGRVSGDDAQPDLASLFSLEKG